MNPQDPSQTPDPSATDGDQGDQGAAPAVPPVAPAPAPDQGSDVADAGSQMPPSTGNGTDMPVDGGAAPAGDANPPVEPAA